MPPLINLLRASEMGEYETVPEMIFRNIDESTDGESVLLNL